MKWKFLGLFSLIIFLIALAKSVNYLRGPFKRDVEEFKFGIRLAGINLELDLDKIEEISAGDGEDTSDSKPQFF